MEYSQIELIAGSLVLFAIAVLIFCAPWIDRRLRRSTAVKARKKDESGKQEG